MSFQLKDIKEYWTIVSINARKDDVRILQESPDLLASDWIDDDDLEYNVIYWVEKHQQQPGVYKLILEPEFEELEEGQPADTERDLDILRTVSFEVLYTL